MNFYKIKQPKTIEFIKAIDSMEYFTMEQLETKRKQLRLIYPDFYISFLGMTNNGGYPVIHDYSDIEAVLSEYYKDWYQWSEEDQENELELIAYQTIKL